MDTDKFKGAYGAVRNGTDAYHRNPLYPSFLYSDGVHECAEAGCYWLLDILGTELPAVFSKHEDLFALLVEVTVADDNSAVIRGTWDDNNPDDAVYRREIDYTDLPVGTWQFYVGKENSKLVCILLTEY